MGQFVHTGTKVPLKTLHSNVSGVTVKSLGV